jgi:NADH-quinone oxidoreductase subunit M
MVNHGLSTGALFLIVGLIYDRRHTRLISELGGLSKVMPVYAVLFAIIMFSSMGLPGLNGFVGEFLILLGAFQVSTWWAAVAVTGIVLGAAYMLWLYQRTMFGEVENPKNLKLTDLNGREIATLVPIIVMCFWIGLYPPPFLNSMKASVDNVLVQMDAKKKARVAAAPAPAGESPAGAAPAAPPPAPAPGTKR